MTAAGAGPRALVPRAVRAAAVLLLGALPFLAGLRGETIAWRDLPDHFYPRSIAIGGALARGELPRWDPLVFHGASWFGTRSPGVFYPTHLVYAVLPVEVAMAVVMALHAALAVLGARTLLRPVVRRDDAAWAGGLAFGLGGFVLSQHGILTYMLSASWLPWAAHGGRLLGWAPRRGAACIATSVGMTLLAVEPQGALVAAGVAAAFGLAGTRPVGPRGLGWAAGGVALGALVAAIQLVPLLLEIPRSDRTVDSFQDHRYGAPFLGVLSSILAPGVLGEGSPGWLGYWGKALWKGEFPWCSLYVGVGGLAAVVAACAAFARPRGGSSDRAQAAPGLALLGVGLALATIDPGRAIGLRFSAKWLVVSALGLGWLVAVGWRRLGAGAGAWALRAHALLAVCAGLLAALPSLWGRWAEADPALEVFAIQRSAGACALRLGALALLSTALARVERDLPVRRGLVRALLLGLLALDLTTAGASGVHSTRAALRAEPPLCAALRGHTARPPGVPPPLFVVNQRLGQYRVDSRRDDLVALVLLGNRDILAPNQGQAHGIRTVMAFESTRPRWLHLVQSRAQERWLPAARAVALLDGEALVASARALGTLTDVRVLLPLLEGRKFAVANRACPPWAYVAFDGRPVRTEPAVLDAVVDTARVVTRTVILGPEGAELAGEAAPALSAPSSATVSEVEFAAERVALTVTSDAPGWLVVRESFSTDWRATLDGAPAPMARADALFRALRVPAGRSRVVMVYDPWWWTPSLLLSALGLAGLAGLVVLDRRGNRGAAGGTS